MKKRIVFAMVSLLLASLALAAPDGAQSLKPPHSGKIRVAFVLSEDAVMIDFAGPWEVFQDVMLTSSGSEMDAQHPFELFTAGRVFKVADSRVGRRNDCSRLHL